MGSCVFRRLCFSQIRFLSAPSVAQMFFIYLFIYLFIYVFLGLHPRHMEIPRLGVGAVATCLHHYHSNTRFEPHLRPTPQLMATSDP